MLYEVITHAIIQPSAFAIATILIANNEVSSEIVFLDRVKFIINDTIITLIKLVIIIIFLIF